MIEFLLSLILIAISFVAYQLRKLPWYLSELRDIQIMIWKEILVVSDSYRAKDNISNRLHEEKERDRHKIFEINNKLTEIIKLNERNIETYCKTRPDGHLREILELLRSIDSK